MWIFQKLKKLNVATLESVKTFVWRVSIVVTMVLISLESAVIIPVEERLSGKVPAQKSPLAQNSPRSFNAYDMVHIIWITLFEPKTLVVS